MVVWESKGVTMEIDYKKKQEQEVVKELYEAILLLKNTDEVHRFFKDLCTPQEITALSERWRVCKILDQRQLSYREINSEIGASIATIGRVARFLNNESYGGYQLVLDRMKNNRKEKLEKNEK